MPVLRACTDAGAWAPLLTAAALTVGCASTGVTPRPFPTPPTRTTAETTPARPAVPEAAAGLVVETALTLLGAPYVNGGSTPAGFDCSGLTQWVFAQHGIAIPRETREQYREGAHIGDEDVAAGDLLFFSTVDRGASHVGIALDGDRFVHAPSSRGVVRIERRSSRYWHQRYIGARRVTPSAADPAPSR